MKAQQHHGGGLAGIAAITLLMVSIFVISQFLDALAPERPESFLRKVTGQPDIELCEIGSMGFNTVNDERSPIVVRLFTANPPMAGQTTRVTVAFTTARGRTLLLEELEEVHTEKIHLLIISPDLTDYHHKHPFPTGIPGEFDFEFTPAQAGTYRVFADLVSAATGRPVYGSADLFVEGEKGEGDLAIPAKRFRHGPYLFSLQTPVEGLQSRRPALLTLRLENTETQGRVKPQAIMGAYAHLVAFDTGLTGFAHMHPVEEGLEIRLDPIRPEMQFMFFAERPGFYKIWAQLKLEEREVFAPFGMEVR